VGGTEFSLNVLFGDLDEAPVGCSGVLVDHSVIGDLPFGRWDVADDDPRPFDRFHEDRLGAALGENSENGGARFLDLGVEGIVREVDLEVHGDSPFCGVSLNVELRAGPIDLGYDDLDRESGALGRLFISAVLEEIPLSVIPGTFGRDLRWG